MAPPWARIVPFKGPSLLTTSAVTENDLFLMFRTLFSDSRSSRVEDLGVAPDELGRPARSGLIRSAVRSSRG